MMHLAAGGPSAFTVQLFVILAAAGFVGVVMHRVRLATVPAFLIAGALLGPGGFGVISSGDDVSAIANLALVLLMFGIGLHLDATVLRGSARALAALGVISTLLSAVLLWPVGLLLGADGVGALAVAMGLSLSSTAVVMRVLQQRRETGRMIGRMSLAVLVIQDVLVIAMLLVLPALADLAGTREADPEAGPDRGVFVNSLIRVAGVTGIVLFGRFLLPRLLREAAKMRSDEVLLVLATAFAIGAAAGTGAMGLSPELGAFLGGFLLSGTPFRHQLSGQIGALRDLFIAVFFTTFGMRVEPSVLVADAPTVLTAAVLLMVVKLCVIGGVAWGVGSSPRLALRAGLTLCQAGEFALLLLAAAAAPRLGLIGEETTSRAVAVVAISLIVTPGLMSLAPELSRRVRVMRTAPWLRSATPTLDVTRDAEPDGRAHVIVAGYGVVGRAVADRLHARGLSVTVVELNPETVRKQRGLGRSIVYGDISNAEVLESAGIGHAAALVLTVPDEESVMSAAASARRLNAGVRIVARASFLSRGMLMRALGVDEVVVEEVAAAEAMGARVEACLESDFPNGGDGGGAEKGA